MGALSAFAVIFSIVIPPLGVILGLYGLAKIPERDLDKRLFFTAIVLGIVGSIIWGVILAAGSYIWSIFS